MHANFTLMYFFYFLNDNDWLKFCLIFSFAEKKKMSLQLITHNVLNSLLRWTHVKTSCSFCCFRLFVSLICGAVMMNRSEWQVYLWSFYLAIAFCSEVRLMTIKITIAVDSFLKCNDMHLYENRNFWHAVTTGTFYTFTFLCYSLICKSRSANVKHNMYILGANMSILGPNMYL